MGKSTPSEFIRENPSGVDGWAKNPPKGIHLKRIHPKASAGANPPERIHLESMAGLKIRRRESASSEFIPRHPLERIHLKRKQNIEFSLGLLYAGRVSCGVLLLNLGSPNSTEVGDLKRYLLQFLLDPYVMDMPWLKRQILVRGLIVPKRAPRSAEAYRRIWQADGSPLITISRQQQAALQKRFDFPIELAMRYGKPESQSALAALRKADVQQIFIAPLYPHYAKSSYLTALEDAKAALKKLHYRPELAVLEPFYAEPAYIAALAEKARETLGARDHLLISFHGLPESHLRKADPSKSHCLHRADCCECPHRAHGTCYRHQCLSTARKLIEALGLPKENWSVSFQSRLGSEPWLKPSTEDQLKALAGRCVEHVKVICPSFVADCLETLEEIAMEGEKTYLEGGGKSLKLIPCLNESPAFIDFLSQKIETWARQTHRPHAEA